MQVKIHIHKQQVKRFIATDDQGNPIGEKVRLFFRLPDHPRLSGFVVVIDYPCTKADVDSAISAKAIEIKAQMDKDAAIRQQAENMGYPKVTVDGEEYFEIIEDV